jgi:hypothetical protein
MAYKTVKKERKECGRDNGIIREMGTILSELRRPNMLSQDIVQQQQQRPLTLEEDRFWCDNMRAAKLCEE